MKNLLKSLRKPVSRNELERLGELEKVQDLVGKGRVVRFVGRKGLLFQLVP